MPIIWGKQPEKKEQSKALNQPRVTRTTRADHLNSVFMEDCWVCRGRERMPGSKLGHERVSEIEKALEKAERVSLKENTPPNTR